MFCSYVIVHVVCSSTGANGGQRPRGPEGVVGKWDTAGDVEGILFPDGNKWPKKSKKKEGGGGGFGISIPKVVSL